MIAVLFVITSTSAAWYHEERAARAGTHLDAGRAFAATGNLEAAVSEFRAALLLERGEPAAEELLALTLQRLGRLDEAESYLTELLARDPVSGPLNLALARIRVQTSPVDGRRLYQRAIYGEWADADADQRLTARFELAGLLRAAGTREEQLAELLRLEANVPRADTAAQRRLADLFVAAGDTREARAVLAAAAEAAPRDAELLGHLAQVEAASGLPADARRTLRLAIAAQPDRTDLRRRLAVIERVLVLHPALPNLRLTARVRRARDLLAAVVAQTAACGDAEPPAASRRSAQARLGRRAVSTADAADEDLTEAIQLWMAAEACRGDDVDAAAIGQIADDLQRVEATP